MEAQPATSVLVTGAMETVKIEGPPQTCLLSRGRFGGAGSHIGKYGGWDGEVEDAVGLLSFGLKLS